MRTGDDQASLLSETQKFIKDALKSFLEAVSVQQNLAKATLHKIFLILLKLPIQEKTLSCWSR